MYYLPSQIVVQGNGAIVEYLTENFCLYVDAHPGCLNFDFHINSGKKRSDRRRAIARWQISPWNEVENYEARMETILPIFIDQLNKAISKGRYLVINKVYHISQRNPIYNSGIVAEFHYGRMKISGRDRT